MIVEDEPTILHLLQDLLEMEGYECRGLDHPRLVSDVVARWRPDVVLLDVMLPQRSGIEIAEDLQAQGYSPAHLIAMSASGVMQDLAWHSGLFTAVLSKPFDLQTLSDVVERTMLRLKPASTSQTEDMHAAW